MSDQIAQSAVPLPVSRTWNTTAVRWSLLGFVVAVAAISDHLSWSWTSLLYVVPFLTLPWGILATVGMVEYFRRGESRGGDALAVFQALWGLGSLLSVAATFLGCWGYAVASWGFLLGVAFGWIPAAIIAAMAFFLWAPLLSLASAGVILLLVFS